MIYCCWYGAAWGFTQGKELQRATLFATGYAHHICPMSNHLSRHAHVELNSINGFAWLVREKPILLSFGALCVVGDD
jgi:hypothetical protein